MGINTQVQGPTATRNGILDTCGSFSFCADAHGRIVLADRLGDYLCMCLLKHTHITWRIL